MMKLNKTVIMIVLVAVTTIFSIQIVSAAAAVSPPENYKGVLNIVATAYAPGPHDNGKWGNLTHIGTNVRPGIIAVDPKVIPLKSRVYIEFADGHGIYATAEDTGGAIKGNRIDIAMWTVAEAYQFGMQKVKVYIL
jgi:3D (Asp-Asp-Asp) domain-containing protein